MSPSPWWTDSVVYCQAGGGRPLRATTSINCLDPEATFFKRPDTIPNREAIDKEAKDNLYSHLGTDNLENSMTHGHLQSLLPER